MIKDTLTTNGGSRAYHYVMSKWLKDKEGHFVRVPINREMMMDKLKRPLRSDEIVHHVTPGAHTDGPQGKLEITTRGENTAKSNRERKGGALYKKLKIRKMSQDAHVWKPKGKE